MSGRDEADSDVRGMFESIWEGDDPWNLESSEHEQRRYERHLELLDDRRYGRALEIGCGAGAFTRQLSPLTDQLVAIDVSETAVERARAHGSPANVAYRVVNAMDFDLVAEGPWDLVVLSDTIEYLGWLYPLSDVARFARQVFESVAVGGRCLLGSWILIDEYGLATPWLVRTYHDLFRNVGFELEHEEQHESEPGWDELQVVRSLFAKPRVRM
jgi:SAM-dependent methyltransferase